MTEPSRRRKWRRWVVAVCIVLAVLVGRLGLHSSDKSDIEEARSLRLGQSRDEVIALLGSPHQEYLAVGNSVSPGYSGLLYGSTASTKFYFRLIAHLVGSALGRSSQGNLLDMEGFPVEVRLDAAGRVTFLRRGAEIVKVKQPAE